MYNLNAAHCCAEASYIPLGAEPSLSPSSLWATVYTDLRQAAKVWQDPPQSPLKGEL